MLSRLSVVHVRQVSLRTDVRIHLHQQLVEKVPFFQNTENSFLMDVSAGGPDFRNAPLGGKHPLGGRNTSCTARDAHLIRAALCCLDSVCDEHGACPPTPIKPFCSTCFLFTTAIVCEYGLRVEGAACCVDR